MLVYEVHPLKWMCWGFVSLALGTAALNDALNGAGWGYGLFGVPLTLAGLALIHIGGR